MPRVSSTLKSLPAPLHHQLKARAARHKRSLNQKVIAVLEGAEADSRPVDVTANKALLTALPKACRSLANTFDAP